MNKKTFVYIIITGSISAIILWVLSYAVHDGYDVVASGLKWLLFSFLFLLAEIIAGFVILSKQKNRELGWSFIISPLLLLLTGFSICSYNILIR